MNNKKIRWLSFAAIIVAAMFFGYLFKEHLTTQRILQMLEAFGIWAPIGYILFYAVATVLFIPGSVLTLTGGFLFGPWLGTLINLTGAVIGAIGSFLIARYLAQDWVANKASGKLKDLIDGVSQEGWRFVAVVRLMPVLPFNLLNYAFGLTSVSLRAYVIASAVFMLPGAAAYTFVGSLGRTALQGEVARLVKHGMLAVGLLVFLSIIPWLVKRFRNKK